MALSDNIIDNLEYSEYNPILKINTMTKLPRKYQGWIRAFIDFVKNKKYKDESDLENKNSEDFNIFHIEIFNPDKRITATITNPKQQNSKKDIDQFKKNIKREKSHYTVLKYDWQWDKWRRNTVSTARSHDCYNVFNPNYKPLPKDQDVFNEKQIFIYSVFEEKLQTDTGKHLVRKHELDYDAQTIFKQLTVHAKESTQATIEASKFLNYIASVCLHRSKWKGSYYSFILHWCDKVRLYKELIPVNDRFTDNFKMAMLQNTVTGIPALNSVKTQESHDQACGSKPFTYDTYLTLLLSAASTQDAARGFKNNNIRNGGMNRNLEINITDANYDQQIYYDVHNHNIDTACLDINDNEFGALDINRSNTQLHKKIPYSGPKMSKERWKSLSIQEQQIWDTLSNQSKATILGISPPSQTNTTHNLHNISAADYILMLHRIKTNEDYIPTKHVDVSKSDTNKLENLNHKTDLLTYLTKQEYPGDIRNVLSTSKAIKDEDTKQYQGQTDKYDTKRKINSAISYNVSNTVSSTKGSLIDRGANGGLAGNDVRVICRHNPPRLIDVSGIGGHNVKNLEIVTAGGVVKSQRGEVIAILNQYALLGMGCTIHSSIQLEHYKIQVDDKSLRHGGTQTITTPDNYIHPLDFINGLAYIKMRPYTDEEWDRLPHVMWTSDENWDPSIIDNIITDDTL